MLTAAAVAATVAQADVSGREMPEDQVAAVAAAAGTVACWVWRLSHAAVK